MNKEKPAIIVCGAYISSDHALGEDLKQAFSVIRCENRSTLLQRLKRKRPEAILLEIDFQKEGFAVLRQLKKRYPAIPVIALGSDKPTEIAAQAFQNGVTDFFLLPYKKELIVERAIALIRSQKIALKGGERRT